MHSLMVVTRFILVLAAAVFCVACAPALQNTRTSSLEGMDLVAMTDDMAMKIAGSPAVREALARDGKLRVVVLPVENYMTGEVLAQGPADAFTARVRALLAVHHADAFTWIMNRDAYYSLRGAELEGIDLGPNPDSIQPQYALQARFDSLTQEDRKKRSSSYLCVYFLTDIQTREVLWTDKYEVQKTVVKGFLD